MLILLPPSETKRVGGEDGTKLDYAKLRFPELHRLRRPMVRAVQELARDADAAVAALRLGPTQRGEVAHNRAVTRSATMPAVDRYTGVLFDAIHPATLPPSARAYLAEHVVIHSAILGPIGALDPIPAYRLSHDSRVPGLKLKQHWAAASSAVLASHPGLILDARSEAYAALGPVPNRTRSAFLRVVTDANDGKRRALNHFNKHAKGALVRELSLSLCVLDSVEELIDWGASRGIRLEHGAGTGPGGVDELELVI
jgi:cytoplasmic iron level regulating protein YaaA (DUF328/UPF0246 family)